MLSAGDAMPRGLVKGRTSVECGNARLQVNVTAGDENRVNSLFTSTSRAVGGLRDRGAERSSPRGYTGLDKGHREVSAVRATPEPGNKPLHSAHQHKANPSMRLDLLHSAQHESCRS